MQRRQKASVLLAGLASLCVATGASATVVDNFNSGVILQENHPDPANGGTSAFGVWYDITSDAFGGVAADTLNGSPALRITDGGFTNGVYNIYQAVVPTTGLYTLSALMKVTEDPAQLNSIRAYQIGAVVNGVHRGVNPSDLATLNPADPGTGIGNYMGLTAGDDNALPPQIVETGQFFATAGDNLLVAFSTDLDTGDFDTNSATWGAGGFVTVDDITLNFIPEPASLALVSLAALGLMARRRSA